MTIGFGSYNYNVPNVGIQQKGTNTNVLAQKSIGTTNNTEARTKSNKGAVATALISTIGIALTALAASKGKKVTGSGNLLTNIKVGFKGLKDDTVKVTNEKILPKAKELGEKIKSSFKSLRNKADDVAGAATGATGRAGATSAAGAAGATSAAGAAGATSAAGAAGATSAAGAAGATSAAGAAGATSAAGTAASSVVDDGLKGIKKVIKDDYGNTVALVTNDDYLVKNYSNGFLLLDHTNNTFMKDFKFE